MLKTVRQAAILSLIQRYAIETQDELTTRLKAEGIPATQATISRDIKELRLTKTPGDGGHYRYTSQEKGEAAVSDRLCRMFRDSVMSMAASGQIIVVRTLSGSADVAGEAIDSLQLPGVLGTLAGDNTIFIVARTLEDVPGVLSHFQAMLDA